MTWVSAVLPGLSVLLGAGITYWLGVRTRRHTKAEDAYHDAIAAIASATAARSWINEGSWAGASPEDLAEFTTEQNRQAIHNTVQVVAKARTALARASAYDPQLAPLLNVPAHQFIDAAAESAIARLRVNLGHRKA